MDSECEVCARLWREYADVVNAYIKLDSRLRIAKVEGNVAKAKLLATDVEFSKTAQLAAKAALRKHERSAHEPQEQSGTARH
jgi:hypothetical protein